MKTYVKLRSVGAEALAHLGWSVSGFRLALQSSLFYRNQAGTMYLSFTAFCRAEVARAANFLISARHIASRSSHRAMCAP